MLPRVLFLVMMAAVGTLAGFSRSALDRLAEGTSPQEELLYLPNGKHLKILSLGHANVLADGIYLWGNPSDAGTMRMWGLPVVSNESLTVGTALVGSFLLPWITLFERRGIVVERGFVGTNFTDGMQTIRASGRWAVAVYRPPAFCTATGL